MDYNLDYIDEPLKARLKKENGKSHFSTKELGYKTIQNAVVLPAKYYPDGSAGGGIISENGYEEGSANRGGGVQGFPYKYNKENVEYDGETVIYIGMFEKIWGHCITDNLALIWFLKSEFYKKYKNCKIIYLSPTAGLVKNFVELLSLLGIDIKKCERVTSPTKYREVILPDKCFVMEGGSFFTKEYRALISEIAKKVPTATDSKYEKIYLTRSHFAKNDVGEKKLERFFKNFGYTVVSPEKYTLKQQIAMFKRCRFLASTEGSVSYNSIFMEEGGKLLLLPRANYITRYSLVLNHVNNPNVTFVSANLSILTSTKIPWGGPNFYYVSDHLLKYFGEETLLEEPKYWIENFRDFKKYFKQYISLWGIEERIADSYYYIKTWNCMQKYEVMRKKVFPYCLLRIKYLPKRIQNYLRQKRK